MIQFDLISAMVLLSDSSKRQLDETEVVNAQNVHQFVPNQSIVNTVQLFFKENGFTTGPFVGVSFSIEATQEKFETFFNVDLNVDLQKGITIGQTGDYQLPIKNIPEIIQALISQIYFSPPVELFF